MTTKLAVLGDRTSNGKIISATANYFSDGKQVAQNNDQDRVLCLCPGHKVIAGSNFFTG